MIERLQKALNLISLQESSKQELILTVRHAAGEKAPEIFGRHVKDITAAPIEYMESETFEIFFSRYLTFLVCDESYFHPQETDVFEGKQFRRYQKSLFLDFIEKNTSYKAVQPHSLFHYGVYCQNHLIDVITPNAPHISYIGMTSR